MAVKLFHEAIAADPDFVRRFEPDAQAIAALEHPHIAPIYDYWRERSCLHRLSVPARRQPSSHRRGEPLERDRVLRVVEQVSSALAFAHRQGVGHETSDRPTSCSTRKRTPIWNFLIRRGPAPAPSEDVRELARFAKRLLPNEPAFEELPRGAELGTDVPEADAFAEAARIALDPGAAGPFPTG